MKDNTAARRDTSALVDIADQDDGRNEHTDVQEEPGGDFTGSQVGSTLSLISRPHPVRVWPPVLASSRAAR